MSFVSEVQLLLTRSAVTIASCCLQMFLQHQKDRLLLLELGWKLVSMWELNDWLNYTLRAHWQRRIRVIFLRTALT